MSYINYDAKTKTSSYDEGQRKYMLQIYNYMAIALTLTGITAYSAANIDFIARLMYVFNSAGYITGLTPLAWIVNLAPIALVFMLGNTSSNMSVERAQSLFWVFSGLMGLSLSSIFFTYTGESITRVFFITSSVFGGMSLYGYTTKKDLTSMGSFLIMGLMGVFFASLINIFLKSPGIYFALSFVSVGIFTGLVAYDTQKIKNIYYQMADGRGDTSRYSIVAALNLYMSFINLFLSLLRFFGQQKRDN